MPEIVAIFWDFDSLHNDLMVAAHGAAHYRRFAQRDQAEAVDVEAVDAFTRRYGEVIHHRAFANWVRMREYGPALNRTSVDLLQLFPTAPDGSTDVVRRMVLEITDVLQANDQLTTVVIIGGGSEYARVAKLVQQRGCKLIGMGLEEFADEFWMSTCDEFVFYHDLKPRSMNLSRRSGLTDDEVRDLIVRTMNELSNHYGEAWIQQVKIKPALVRNHADFDEGDYGFESFSTFLRSRTDILKRRHRPGQQEPEFSLLPDLADFQERATGSSAGTGQRVNYYLRVAGQQGIRMPDPVMMWEGIDVYASFLQDNITFGSFTEIDEECLRLLREDFPNVSMTEVKKIRQVLFKCFLFRPSEDNTIGFHEEVHGLEDIEDRYFDLMLARIAGNVSGPIDYEALSLALTGNADQADRLERLHGSEDE